MAESRKSFTYTNAAGVPVTEPVSVQGQEWAKDALVSGKVDPNIRSGSQPRTDGWKTQIPDGAEFNFQAGRLSTLLSEIEARGFPAWSSLTTYTVPAYVWGSDGNTYTALQASGPGAGAKDPVSEPLYWGLVSIPVGAAGQVIAVSGDVPLPGTLVCNGASFSTITYDILFNAIGYKYGGTGGFFNIPDYEGYFLRGHDPNGSVDLGNEITFTASASIGSNVLTAVSSFVNLEVGMTVTLSTGGAVVVGTKITDFNYSTVTTAASIPLISITLDTVAVLTAVTNLTVTNRQDRGDGTLARVVGTKQSYLTGKHQHALVYQADQYSTTPAAVQDFANPRGSILATVSSYVVNKDGTYFYQGADTRPDNISVLYCIKFQ